MNPTVRPAKESDIPFLVEGNLGMALETEGKRLELATLEAGVRGGLAHPEYCRYFVAEDEGESIGQAMVTYEWTDWRNGIVWWLQSVYVRENRRGRGVFRAIFEAIAAEARRDPRVRGMRLYVDQENTRAQAVYKKLGMEETGYLLFDLDWSGDRS